MQLEIPRPTMKKTSQGAVSSQHTSGATNVGKAFGRKSGQRLSVNMPSHPQPNTRKGSQPRGFRIFHARPKASRPKKREAFVLPSSTVHPFFVEPNAVLDDDDSTSECSDHHSASRLAALHCTGYSHAVTETVAEENEECDDFETQSETEPATPPSQPQTPFVGCYRRPSLPGPTPIPIAGQTRYSMSLDDLPGSLYHKRPISNESWDTDFDLDSKEIQVPSSVEGSQLAIRMDMYNIRDFTNQIETLKSLRAKRNQLYNKLGNTWPADRTRLESTYSTCWEEADVIIDLSDSTQDTPPTFGGGRNISVGVERQGANRHLQVLKRLFVDRSSEDSDDVFTEADEPMDDDDEDDSEMDLCDNEYDAFEFDDSDKENCACATTELGTGARTNRSVDPADANGYLTVEKDGERTQHDKVRVSVEDIPGLIDRLRQLQQRLSQHVDQLTVAARMSDSFQEIKCT